MRKYLLLFLFCGANFFITVSAKDNIASYGSRPLNKVVREIAKLNVFDYSANAATDKKASLQSSRYHELLKTAGTDDLVRLASKHKNAVVRLYAYRAIVEKLKEIPKNILDQFNNDSTMVNTTRDGVAGKATVKKIAGSLLY